MNHVKVTGVELDLEGYQEDPDAEMSRVNTLMAVGADTQRQELGRHPLPTALGILSLVAMLNVGQSSALQSLVGARATAHEAAHVAQLLEGITTGWDTDTGDFIITVLMGEGVEVALSVRPVGLPQVPDDTVWPGKLNKALDGYSFANVTDALHAVAASEQSSKVEVPEDLSGLLDSPEFEQTIGFRPDLDPADDDEWHIGFEPE